MSTILGGEVVAEGFRVCARLSVARWPCDLGARVRVRLWAGDGEGHGLRGGRELAVRGAMEEGRVAEVGENYWRAIQEER